MPWVPIGQWLLRNPLAIVVMLMAIGMGGQWIKINSLKGDVVDLEAKVVKIERNYNTCKTNEATLNGAIDSLNFQAMEFEQNIGILAEQVEKEKERVVYWRDKYNNKVCYDPNSDTVTVSPDDRRVLNDEKNTDAVNRINDLFKP